MSNTKHRAFLKWAGGKFGIVEHISKKLPKAAQLIEPFVGAGSVFLNTSYKRYLLNDINPDLITLYQLLTEEPDTLVAKTKALFSAQTNREDYYYDARNQFNSSRCKYERSSLFIYLNRHGYNGLCRYNKKGDFNVPFGRYKRPYFPEEEMLFFAEKAQHATFTCLPFEDVFKLVTSNSVVYCDPPYVPISSTASFTAYSQHSFGLEAQQKLAELALATAEEKAVNVLLSNHDLPVTRSMYRGAKVSSLQVNRTISQSAKKRKPVKELLALYKAKKT